MAVGITGITEDLFGNELDQLCFFGSLVVVFTLRTTSRTSLQLVQFCSDFFRRSGHWNGKAETTSICIELDAIPRLERKRRAFFCLAQFEMTSSARDFC